MRPINNDIFNTKVQNIYTNSEVEPWDSASNINISPRCDDNKNEVNE
jgi:hypothetical protein